MEKWKERRSGAAEAFNALEMGNRCLLVLDILSFGTGSPASSLVAHLHSGHVAEHSQLEGLYVGNRIVHQSE